MGANLHFISLRPLPHLSFTPSSLFPFLPLFSPPSLPRASYLPHPFTLLPSSFVSSPCLVPPILPFRSFCLLPLTSPRTPLTHCLSTIHLGSLRVRYQSQQTRGGLNNGVITTGEHLYFLNKPSTRQQSDCAFIILIGIISACHFKG